MLEGLVCKGYIDHLGVHYETRFLIVDLIEVFTILRGFENVNLDRFFDFFQVIGDGVRRDTISNCSRRDLDVGKFKFASIFCEEWNRLGRWGMELSQQRQWIF